MAKIDVVLRAVLDDGKGQRFPDEVVAMEKAEAERAAAMGLVVIVKKPAASRTKEPAKEQSKTSGETPPLPADDDGKTGNGEEVEDV
ncbi:MAG: hypothetical protein LBH14_07000 [Desulfobulbaceae bacterium]|jgi:hypothetical protein|nr:hypothetical protein [Desulfobulbaceae bacterium]